MNSGYLISYYGDDFTGSTDVLEALSSNGVATVLFTSIPDQSSLDRFAGYRAIGLAGASRSESPEWMDRELPAVFDWLRSLQTPVAVISRVDVCFPVSLGLSASARKTWDATRSPELT